jgi:hypothetical protein
MQLQLVFPHKLGDKMEKENVPIPKWLRGLVMTLLVAFIVSLGSWVYTQDRAVSSLQKDVRFQQKIVSTHASIISATNKQTNIMSGDIKATKVHIEHMKESLSEIKDMLKELRKR